MKTKHVRCTKCYNTGKKKGIETALLMFRKSLTSDDLTKLSGFLLDVDRKKI